MRRRLPESAARRKLAWLMTERRRAGLWRRWVEWDVGWPAAAGESEAN